MQHLQDLETISASHSDDVNAVKWQSNRVDKNINTRGKFINRRASYLQGAE